MRVEHTVTVYGSDGRRIGKTQYVDFEKCGDTWYSAEEVVFKSNRRVRAVSVSIDGLPPMPLHYPTVVWKGTRLTFCSGDISYNTWVGTLLESDL